MIPSILITIFCSPIDYEIPCGVRGVNTSNSIKIVGGTNAETGKFF